MGLESKVVEDVHKESQPMIDREKVSIRCCFSISNCVKFKFIHFFQDLSVVAASFLQSLGSS